jgi:hypothetical protein
MLHTKFLSEKVKGGDPSEYLDMDDKIILERIIDK